MTTRRLMMFGQLEETKRPNLLVKSTLLFPSECCVYRLQSLSIELQLHHNLTTAHTIMTSLMIPGRSGRKEEETQLMPRPCLCEIKCFTFGFNKSSCAVWLSTQAAISVPYPSGPQQSIFLQMFFPNAIDLVKEPNTGNQCIL